MPLPFNFNFKNPDYIEVFDWRIERLKRIRADPQLLNAARVYYRDHPAQFIIDWGVTFDPRNVSKGKPATIPFILFPKQEEWVAWVMERWKKSEPGVCLKSREVGVSWLSVALGATLCLFHKNMVVGYGSRKAMYVDTQGDPLSLFYKARQFLKRLPVEFNHGWNEAKHSKSMLIEIPVMDSRMTGEGGDNIGRGNRTSLTMIDEAGHLQRPQLIEASLSETTNCRIDVGTPNGTGNPFAQKWINNRVSKFALHWRDDPRKDEDWYERRKAQIGDPVIIAQELDMDLTASMEGILIPSEWVRAAIDAHIKLDIHISGEKRLSYDVADQGADKNATAGRHGILLNFLDQWSGGASDIFRSTEKVFNLADENGFNIVDYDADGMGAAVRGDARKINERRMQNLIPALEFRAFRGSGKVINPLRDPFSDDVMTDLSTTEKSGRKNEDYFQNAKAQEYFRLRRRFLNTFKALNGEDYNENNLISISSKIAHREQLIMELSQPQVVESATGKMLIDKKPDGQPSPNLADAVMIAFSKARISRGFF